MLSNSRHPSPFKFKSNPMTAASLLSLFAIHPLRVGSLTVADGHTLPSGASIIHIQFQRFG
jgi:hypothetical protein